MYIYVYLIWNLLILRRWEIDIRPPLHDNFLLKSLDDCVELSTLVMVIEICHAKITLIPFHDQKRRYITMAHER